jgi:hypothetical protein
LLFGPLVAVAVTALVSLDVWLGVSHHAGGGLGAVARDPDLFARIRPILASLKPGARPDRRVSELKSWARVAVTTWVITAITALIALGVLLVANISGFLRGNWAALITELRGVSAGVHAGDVVLAADTIVSLCMLMLPVAGVLLTYLLLCRGLGSWLAVRRGRRDLALAAARVEHPAVTNVPDRRSFEQRDRWSDEPAPP